MQADPESAHAALATLQARCDGPVLAEFEISSKSALQKFEIQRSAKVSTCFIVCDTRASKGTEGFDRATKINQLTCPGRVLWLPLGSSWAAAGFAGVGSTTHALVP